MVNAQTIGLLQQPRFVRLALAKLLQLVGQNSLVYGLFILLVRQYESALATSLFVLAASIPSVLVGPFGGVVADALPRKPVILVTMALRAAAVVPFILYDPGLLAIACFTALVWTVYQFFSPAENAALPAVVRREQFTSANAVLNGTGIAAQLLGAGLIAPLSVKLFGANGLFVIVIALFAVAFAFYVSLSGLTAPRLSPSRRVGWIRALPEGLRLIRRNEALMRVTTLQVLLDTALVVVIVAVPTFLQSTLFIAPSNAVFVFAPGALGVAVGLVVAPVMVRFLPPRAVATLGFLLFVVVLLALPWVRPISAWLDERIFLPLQVVEDFLNIRRSIATTALLVPFAGLGITLVRVATRTVFYNEAPPDGLAQVFATQSAIASLAAIPPTLLAGVMIDLLDVQVVLTVTGIAVALLAFGGLVGPPPPLVLEEEGRWAG